MSFWQRLKGNVEAPCRVISETEPVENVITRLKKSPPAHPLCFVIVRRGRELPWTDPYYPKTPPEPENELPHCINSQLAKRLQAKKRRDPVAEDDLQCYTDRKLAEKMDAWGSVLAVGEGAELWALLNNRAKHQEPGDGKPPYAMRVDYDLSAAGYVRYGKAEIQRIGVTGIAKGFRKGQLRAGTPETVVFPLCMVCGKPVATTTERATCLRCGVTSALHEGCRPGANLFGRAAFTIGGGGLRCPKCGASG